MKKKMLITLMEGINDKRLSFRIYTQDKLFWLLWRYFKEKDQKRTWLKRKSYYIFKKAIIRTLEKEEPELIEDFKKTFFISEYQYNKWKQADLPIAKEISQKQVEMVEEILKR